MSEISGIASAGTDAASSLRMAILLLLTSRKSE